MISEILSKFINSAKNEETKALIAGLMDPVYNLVKTAYLLLLFVLLGIFLCLVYMARALHYMSVLNGP